MRQRCLGTYYTLAVRRLSAPELLKQETVIDVKRKHPTQAWDVDLSISFFFSPLNHIWDIFLGLTTLVRRVANATHTEVSRQVFEKTSQFSAVAAVTGVRPCHNIATLRRSGLHPPDSPELPAPGGKKELTPWDSHVALS